MARFVSYGPCFFVCRKDNRHHSGRRYWQPILIPAALTSRGHRVAPGLCGRYSLRTTAYHDTEDIHMPRRTSERPEWLDNGMIFMSDQEPLSYRIRKGYDIYVDEEERTERSRSEEAVRKLVASGVTLVVMNAHKALGFETEAEDIQSAVEFSQLCHQHGLHVGTYIGETLGYETLFQERPEAKNWAARRYDGKHIHWFDQTFRYVPCKFHPGWIGFQKEVTRLAIERIGADFLHYDNVYVWAEPDSCHCPVCTGKFREFLKAKYSPAELKRRIGFSNVEGILPPAYAPEGAGPRAEDVKRLIDPIKQEWVDFRCEEVANMYRELCDYARSLKPDIVLQCNPVHTAVNQSYQRAGDIPRLVPNGHFFWVEDGCAPRIEDGRLISNVRTYKIARTTGTSAFAYMSSGKLSVAEAMAFNLDCIGPAGGGRNAVYGDLISFYLDRRELFRNMETVADVAVLRSFRSLAWENFRTHLCVQLVEQVLIQKKIPFHILYDDDMADVSKYRTLILPDVEFMSDDEIAHVRSYVEGGGSVVVIGKTALHNEISRKRYDAGFNEFCHTDGTEATRVSRGFGRAAYLPKIVPHEPMPKRRPYWRVDGLHWDLPQNTEELVETIHWCTGGDFSWDVEAPDTAVAEVTKTKDGSRCILHVLNFIEGTPLESVKASLVVPDGATVKTARFINPDGGDETVLEFIQKDGRVHVTMPQVDIYGMVVFELGA